jgi:hypothetical protein
MHFHMWKLQDLLESAGPLSTRLTLAEIVFCSDFPFQPPQKNSKLCDILAYLELKKYIKI